VRAQKYTDVHSFNCATEACYFDYPAILAQGREGDLYGSSWWGGTAQYGAIFKVTPLGTATTLVDLNCAGTDGCSSYSGLWLGRDGNFYGANYEGGEYGYGNLFRITPPKTLTVLHQFDGTGSDMGSPWAPPIQGTDGNFYGVAPGGIYKITQAGVYSVINTSTPGGVYAPLIQATNGYFYGTAATGGTHDCGDVFKMSTTGAFQVIYNFVYANGCSPYAPLVQGTDGNFYGTTAYGGSAGGGVVYKLTPGGALTVLHNFTGNVLPTPFAGLVSATDGNLYGAAVGGGAPGYGELFKITKAGVYTPLYDVPNHESGVGCFPYATPIQHTNGKIYGLMYVGGSQDDGTLYSLDVGLAPFVRALSPSGTPGATIEILGQGFTGTTSVKFGSGAASFTVVSGTYLTAVVPANGVTGLITVTTPTGTLKSNSIFKVIPKITGFTPATGSVGTLVTISGTGFMGTTKVTFGGVAATGYTVVSATQITATVPTAAKTGKIAVTTAGGTATSSGTFDVTPHITSFTPTSGPAGTVVTITGVSLTQTTTVTFGGVKAAKFTVVSDTEVEATVPTGAKTGLITITTSGGTATSSGTFTVT
jgi:uncharacterized repeat protein (TIGR03803 family)